MDEQLKEKYNEYLELCKRTQMYVQNIIPGRDLKVSMIKSEELMRKHELAKFLYQKIDELNLNPNERFVLQTDSQ